MALPAEGGAVEKNPDSFGYYHPLMIAAAEHAAVVRQVEEVAENLPVLATPRDVSDPPIDAGKRAKMLDRSWKVLDKRQQTFLTLCRENKFNERATIRLLELTQHKISRTTLRNWKTGDADFIFVYKVMKTVEAGASIDRERLLLRAEEIAESSLEPTPILYQGQPTGFYENSKDTALRANEQLMKAAGMLKGEEKSQRVVVRVVNLAGPEEPAKQVIDVAAEVIE
jgi:hypothetical protein